MQFNLVLSSGGRTCVNVSSHLLGRLLSVLTHSSMMLNQTLNLGTTTKVGPVIIIWYRVASEKFFLKMPMHRKYVCIKLVVCQG